MKIAVQETDQQITIVLTGNLDLSSYAPVEEELVKQIDNSRGKRVVVDMSHVRYVDSGGMAALIRALKESRDKSVDFVLAGPSENLRGVLSLTRLDKVFQVIPAEKIG